MPVRVLVVDDHALLRSGVAALLARQPDIVVAGEAGDGLEGLRRARELQPDVVLLDLHMPGMGGRETLARLRAELPAVRVLMLTVSEAADDLVDCLRGGASGYLLKNLQADALADAVRAVARGDSAVAAEMTGKLVQGLRSAGVQATSPLDVLSAREREILGHIARGASNKEIARDLGLAESTVKVHVQHILRKLDLSGRVQAAVFAVEQGLASA